MLMYQMTNKRISCAYFLFYDHCMSRRLPISFCLSFARRLSEISSIGTLLCYDAFEELRHDSFLHNGFEPLLNWKDGGFETFPAF